MTTIEMLPGANRLIKRPRLTRLLDETKAGVIMLVAPAGYGKTTLAHEWLAGRTHAWYGCTSASADVAALAAGIGRAAASIVPGAADRLLTRVRVTSAPESEVDVLAELLAEDLAAWPNDAWLGLDDYHLAAASSACERFVELLISLCPIHVLIAARERPGWATPRRILYGELAEVGRTALAMTSDEAQEVLVERASDQLPGLLSLADGWPAVIGLAALMPSLEIPHEQLPAPLYDYIAEELYQTADPELQARLCEVSVVPTPTPELLEHLFGADARGVVEEGARIGFFRVRNDGTIDLHRLLRNFLEGKLRERGEEFVADVAERIGEFLIARRRWDDAFAVASACSHGKLLVSLVEHSLREMLAHGRLATLSMWLSPRNSLGHHPVLYLAQAEIALREGRHAEAETLALQATRLLPPGHPLSSRSFYVAGHCAAFTERREIALGLLAKAREFATEASDLREAMLATFLATVELEGESAPTQLAELEALPRETPDDIIRITSARLFLSTRIGNVDAGLDASEPLLCLLDRSDDPFVRSSFLHSLAAALVLASRYRDSLDIVERELAEATEYRLAFIRPHALLVRACAELGIRDFRRALMTTSTAEREAIEYQDIHSQVNASTVRLRVRIVQGASEQGLMESRPAWRRRPGRGMYGEYLASRALAFACVGHEGEAMNLVRKAERVTRQAEARVLSAATRAIVALRRERDAVAGRVADEMLDVIAETGNVDSFVTAYRGFPPLLSAVASNESHREKVAYVLREACDDKLAASVGLAARPSPTSSSRSRLSPRELEVYELLAQGLKNREIARVLFISEVTVKAHLRTIFRKLDVRSRTEAAILATDAFTTDQGERARRTVAPDLSD